MRLGCVVGFAVLVVGIVIGIVIAGLSMGGDNDLDLGNVDDYPLASVVYRSTDGLFVVRRADGEVIAFSDVDPHNPAGSEECRVTFRPDLGVGDEPGRFFDICSGATYDVDGRGLGGDGVDLERLPVSQDEDGELRLTDVH